MNYLKDFSIGCFLNLSPAYWLGSDLRSWMKGAMGWHICRQVTGSTEAQLRGRHQVERSKFSTSARAALILRSLSSPVQSMLQASN